MVKDEWVKAAITDDRVVVELLVRLKQSQAGAAAPAKPLAVIPFTWGIRLPRSRPATPASTKYDVVSGSKEGDSSTRCSPTTPLSWSGGGSASPSATSEGFEDTSLDAKRSASGVRSKGNALTDTNSITMKRSGRKKTFDKLKQEESSLLEERMHLKKELATFHATVEEQRARNKNLKRMKQDLNLHSTKNLSLGYYDESKKPICSQSHVGEASSSNHSCSTLQTRGECGDQPQSDSSEMHNAVLNHDRFFLLPDLNTIPCEEDSCCFG